MNLSRVSKTMSWMLRHCQEPRYIDLKGGWASATDILAALKKKYPDVTINTIEQIVAKDEKGRYSFDSTGTKIRANQGHSMSLKWRHPNRRSFCITEQPRGFWIRS